MPQRSHFSAAENARLRVLAEEFVLRHKADGGQTYVANLIGIGQPALSHMISGRYGFGFRTAQALCKLKGMTVDEFLGREAPRKSVDPNRVLVVRFARAMQVPEIAVKKLEEVELHGNEESRPAIWWMRRLMAYLTLVEDDPAKVSDPLFTRR